MSQETSAEPRHESRDTQATIRLREKRFDAITAAIGCKSDPGRAELIGMDEATIRRARRGILGKDFIANTISALRKHPDELAECGWEATIDNFFEVVDVEEPV